MQISTPAVWRIATPVEAGAIHPISYIGLTDRSGHRLKGTEAEYFMARPEDGVENPGSQSRPDGQGRGTAPGGAGAFPLGRQL